MMQQHEIATRREALDMKQAALAERLGVSRQYLNQLEKNVRPANEERLKQITAILDKAEAVKTMADAIWNKKP